MTDMQETILLKMGELTLKGLNRSSFEKRLTDDTARRLGPGYALASKQSTLYVEAVPGAFPDWDAATEACQKIFGIVSVCRSVKCAKEIEAIRRTAAVYCEPILRRARTFKVEAKRSDKRFSIDVAADHGRRRRASVGNLSAPDGRRP
jgi:thiamine biosynthesis protein ThiI